MIDFNNASFLKLSRLNAVEHASLVEPLLVSGETLLSEYKAMRDFIIFTSKRIIAVNVQGFTGTKKDFTSLPYSKIQAFSVETAGVMDLDAELEIYFSGLGKVKLEFAGQNDIADIGRLIGEKIL